MRDTNSNAVHVVSLAPNSWEGWPPDLTIGSSAREVACPRWPTLTPRTTW